MKKPNPIDKRDILYSDTSPPEALTAYGRMYLEDEHLPDALDFFAAAGDDHGLNEVKSRGIELGDFYLLRRIEFIKPELIQTEDWQALGDKAWEMEKHRDALEAFTKADNDQKKRLAAEALGLNLEEDEEEEAEE